MPKPLGRKGLRAYWVRAKVAHCQADRCLLPGRPIRYDDPPGPDSLDVGHIVPVAKQPGRRAWAITETRPEHRLCNQTAGTILGNRLRGMRRARAKSSTPSVGLDTSRAW